MNDRLIFHVDVNNAFLSWTACERLKQGHKLDVRTISSVIGGDESKRHGVVIAKSNLAKKKGVITGEPLYMARRKSKNLMILSGNYDKYESYSDLLYEYLCIYSADVERYSIDECFIDMTSSIKLFGEPLEVAYKIKNEIKEKLGFTVNVGIGNTKVCAKMASDFQKPDKVHTLYKKEVEEKMWPLKVGSLFMVGKKTEEKLNKLGIYTIKDLANADLFLLKRHFKSASKTIYEYANGIDNSLVTKYIPKNEGISISTTVPSDLTDINSLYKVLLSLSEDIGKRLREKSYYALIITVCLKNNEFITYSHQKRLNSPINTNKDIYNVSKELIDKLWKREPIRLIGIRLNYFTENPYKQISFFDKVHNYKADDDVQLVIDAINKKYNKKVIGVASLINSNKCM